jgi:putative Holliday junction resolvase
MEGKRILAIDYGTKRIGVALSDELGWTAQPLETLNRRTLDRDIAHIASLVRRHEVGQVLLGFPIQLDGREGPAIQAMREFQVRLEQGVTVPVILWDERLTTKAAEDLLIAADVSRKKRKGVVDRIAASILLQSYLASLAPATNREPGSWSDEYGDKETVEPPHDPTDHSRMSPGRHNRTWRRRLSDDSLG